MWASRLIMLLGSSMTQRSFEIQWGGFGIGLSNWYTRVADIILRGQSGYNSRWTLMTLPDIVGSYVPDMLVLFLGNNDSILEGTGQYVPVAEFKSNMIQIMDHFRKVNPQITFLLLTPTKATRLGRDDDVTALYTDVVYDLGKNSHNTAVVDLWHGEFAIDSHHDLHDGLHLNALGNRKVLLAIQHTIRTHFPDFVPIPNEPKTVRDAPIANRIDGDVTCSVTLDGQPRGLTYFFPEWSQLAGTSLEEARLMVDAVRAHSSR